MHRSARSTVRRAVAGLTFAAALMGAGAAPAAAQRNPCTVRHPMVDDVRFRGIRALPATDVAIEARTVGTSKDIPIKTLPCRVQKRERVTDDVILLGIPTRGVDLARRLAAREELAARSGMTLGQALRSAPSGHLATAQLDFANSRACVLLDGRRMIGFASLDLIAAELVYNAQA